MSQLENRSTTGCVPVYDTCAQGPNPSPARVFADATCSVCGTLPPGEYLADLRSPADCYHSEQYLLRWLIRLYGWRVTEPGTIRRGWQPKAAMGAIGGEHGPSSTGLEALEA